MQFACNKELYENNMMKLTGKVLLFDHTLKQVNTLVLSAMTENL